MKHIVSIIILAFLIGCSTKQTEKQNNIICAGMRSSGYGARPFPDQDGWNAAIKSIAGHFPGSAVPYAIWIVGVMGTGPDTCVLQFPTSDSVIPEFVKFEEKDRHEKYLSHFDTTGIKVYLQVESGSANISKVMDLVMKRYKHHPCVAGFGVDVEWYQVAQKEGWGIPVDDITAEKWDKQVKTYDPAYRLFLKHWDRDWMPKTYRSDIIYVSDSQELDSLPKMCNEFTEYWGNYFYPNEVWYQVGYPSDRKWWSKFEKPAQVVGREIAKGIKQKCGIFWVDFTMYEVALKDWQPEITKKYPNKGNMALGKKVICSSMEDTSHSAEMAVDGNVKTRWSSKDVDPSWIIIDLEKEDYVRKTILIWEDSFSKEYTVEVSKDNTIWETVCHQKQGKGNVEEISISKSTRFVKINGIKRAFEKPDYGHSLWEIKVY